MSETPRRRGRPKGTGIDDSTTLRTITSLLADNADLKPTTAIRRSGVTDPSVVRRLREKLKLVPSAPGPRSALPPLAPRRPVTSSVAPMATKPPGKAVEPPRRVDPVEPLRTLSSDPPRIQEAAAKPSSGAARALAEPAAIGIAPQQTEPQQPPGTPSGSPAPNGPSPNEAANHPSPDPQLEALRLAADAAGAMSRLYLHCINHAAQTSPITLALSGQAMMSQWFSSLMSAQIAAQRKPKS